MAVAACTLVLLCALCLASAFTPEEVRDALLHKLGLPEEPRIQKRDLQRLLIPDHIKKTKYTDMLRRARDGDLSCSDGDVTDSIKCAAANVLREAWLVHKHAKRKDLGRTRQHQRNLLRAIHIFRRKRLKQRTLQDKTNAMVDISKMQMIMYDLNANLNCTYLDLEKRIDSLDKKLDEITRLMSEAVQQQTSFQGYTPE